MTPEFDREQQLRRLLAEAVEPVEPSPGAQARLLARARAQRGRRDRRVTLAWAAPVTLGSLLIIFLIGFAVVTHGADHSNSAASSKGAAVLAPAGPSASSAGNAPRRSIDSLRPGANAQQGESTYGSTRSDAAAALPAPKAAVAADLDGDGVPDTVTIHADTLTATLSRDGVQTVGLPPPVGAGARVLGVTVLSTPSGQPVPVVFVRLTQAGADATDTIAAVVGGHLTVLRLGAGPVRLTVDPTHGYGCSQNALVRSGSTTPLVVDGSQLVASPELRAVSVPAAKATGCGF